MYNWRTSREPGFPLKTKFHDFSMIPGYFSRLLNSVLAACAICLNCYCPPKLFLRQKIRVPPVVKYQTKKKRKRQRINSAKYILIKKMCIIETKFHDFSMKMSIFCNSMIIPCMDFLDQISGFPSEWEPC